MSRLTDPLRKIYHTALPLPFKYGEQFRRHFKFYWQHQSHSAEALAAYRLERLQALVKYAFEHVPYYRRRYQAIGFAPGDLKSLADFRALPLLHKEDVVRFHEEFKSNEFAQLNPIKTVTSATTRDGLVMYRSRAAESIRHAIVWRHWFNLGYRYRDPRVQLTTVLPAPADGRTDDDDLNENCRQIDPRAITHEQAAHLYRRIRDYRPRMIFAQPSNLAMLVYYWRQRGLEEFEVPIVYLIGEKVYPEYRSVISRFLGNNIVEYYGNRENSASAGELRDGRMYINADFVHLEFLNAAGEAVVGEQANIVSTGFENYAYPLIRYHTEDVGVDRGHPQDAQVGFPTMEIIGGRGKDLLLSREGLFCPNVISQLKSANFRHYRQIQLEQLSLEDVVIRIEPTREFVTQRDLPVVEQAFARYLGKLFRTEVRVVDSIPARDSCKNRMVISQFALDELRATLRPPSPPSSISSNQK